MGKKKKISIFHNNTLNLIICGFAFVVMLLYILFVDGVDNLVGSILAIKPLFLVIGITLMVIYWFLESFVLHDMVRVVSKKIRFWDTFRIALIGQYFNCITPLSTGGEPMQVYYFSKKSVPVGSSTIVLLCRFIVYQSVMIMFTLAMLLLRYRYFLEELSALTVLTLVGFIINMVVMIALFLLACFGNKVLKPIGWIINLLAKIKIVKHPERTKRILEYEFRHYHKNFRFIRTNLGLVLRVFILTILQMFVYFSISFVLYLGFGLSGFDFITILACQSFVFMISAFVPTPGAMGAAEGLYAAFFGSIFGKHTALSTFIWRILTFYLPILIGMAMTFNFSGKDKQALIRKIPISEQLEEAANSETPTVEQTTSDI